MLGIDPYFQVQSTERSEWKFPDRYDGLTDFASETAFCRSTKLFCEFTAFDAPAIPTFVPRRADISHELEVPQNKTLPIAEATTITAVTLVLGT